MDENERRCPDDGRCHHGCGPAPASCWRVSTCSPLSGSFSGDRWPDEVRAANPLSASDGSIGGR